MNPLSQSSKRGRWKLAFWGLVILFCGMVIGAGITFHAGHVLIFRAIIPSDAMARHATQRIARDLDLTDSQRTQVAKIFAHRVSVSKGILVDAFPRIEEQFDLLRDEVTPVLTEEQKAKWEKSQKRMQRVLTRIHRRLLRD
jgi:hypothetical protein